ncbi:response regulator transcription factor [Enterobacteriaceae bacterium BIT-l23]|jgi:DNA-binding NarL/FixJ family response regulator|nr:response regulator transcription factor [Enterobacteriaceae bacterium BIT-l23]
MSQGRHQNAIIFSRYPAMAAGLEQGLQGLDPQTVIHIVESHEAVTPQLLQKATLAVIDLTGDAVEIEQDFQQLRTLYQTGHHISWVFLIPHFARFTAMQQLLWPGSLLLPNTFTLAEIQNRIHSGEAGNYLGEVDGATQEGRQPLTLSERQVLRLMAKGWSINQISGLLKKSNKTVSAQKNSAMRRLALRSNAEMYAWINSPRGMRELNVQPLESLEK